MPERPDVEIFKQYIDATSLHPKIETVKVDSLSSSQILSRYIRTQDDNRSQSAQADGFQRAQRVLRPLLSGGLRRRASVRSG